MPKNTVKNIGRNNGQLKRGNPGNKGGTGRPPEWFKAECAKLASSEASLKFLSDCIKGAKIEPKCVYDTETKEMKTFLVPVHPETRLKAWEKAADRGFGKPDQPVEVKIPPETDQERQERADRVARRMREILNGQL